MKRTFSLFFLLICVTGTVLAQARVLPNQPPTVLNPNSGFITINELHYGIGLGDTDVPYGKSFFGFTSINGYQINKNFVAAAGTGLSFYNGGMLVPLFLDFRYRFNLEKITPYVFADGGFLLDFTDFTGGTKHFINPGIGGRYTLTTNLAANICTGILIQSGSSHRDTFINFKAGVTYKF